MSRWNLTGRIFAAWALALAGPATLRAQAFQSSFSEVRFDRAQSPASLFSAVQVDLPSGAASIDIPCGPGIGERGLRFRPTLSLRVAPQLAVSSVQEARLGYVMSAGTEVWFTQAADTLYQRGYGSSSFSPGGFDLALWGAMDQLSTYSLPTGGGGSVLGTVPAAMTPAAAAALLNRFGVPGSIGNLPDLNGMPTAPFIKVGTTGHLVLGLQDTSGDVSDCTYLESPTTMYHFPRRILVVQGEVATEFVYVSHRYQGQLRPYIANGNRRVLHGAHYLVKRILNRFGESVSFAYDPDGIGYTATWSTNTAVKIRVEVQPGQAAPTMPSLSQSAYNVGTVTPVRVSYQGINPALSTFTVVLANPAALLALRLETGGQPGTSAPGSPNGQRGAANSGTWGEAALAVQPVSVTQEFTEGSSYNQTVQFTYGPGPSSTWDGVPIIPTVLTKVAFPNRDVILEWEAYRYKPNYSPSEGLVLSGPRRRPAYAYGVHVVADVDVISGVTRGTGYTRKVPVMNWGESVSECVASPDEFWSDPTFTTTVTTGDGQTTVHHFVEPGPANQSIGGEAPVSLGYLKHLEKQVDWYAAGVTSASGSPYRVVVRDHFDAHSIGSPDGSIDNNPVPCPLRTRTWDRDSQTLTATETEGWDGTQLDWTQIRRVSDLVENPDLTVEYSRGSAGSLTDSLGTTDVITRTLDNRVTEWLFGRVSQEETTRQDNTGNGTAAGTPAPVSRTLDPVFNTLTSLNTGDSGLTVTTNLPHGSSGLAAAQMQSATLISPGLALSGQAGVNHFGYDANGFLESIQIQTGSTALTVSQASDPLGRPVSQTDAGGRVTAYERDSAGRLKTITPPGGDLPTAIAYAANLRQVTVTRGAQVSEYVFNGFGERVLERRQDPDGAWTHRVYGRDPVGRDTGVTLWLAGRGLDHETWWALQNLFQPVTVTIPGESICKRWGPLNPDTGERACVQWQTSSPTNVIYPALSAGAPTVYDGRGRVASTQDNAGVTTTYNYPVNSGLLKVVTVAGLQATSLLHDAPGRLKQVTDAKGQVTKYLYDASSRVVEVRQYYSAWSYQTRTWTYNRLGWLTNLVQPESGLTLFQEFTVLGAPKVTNYNGRVVRSTYDWTGRPTTTVSDDSSVSQTFTYDVNGKAGKLDSSNDIGVATTYGYNSATGRLTTLTTQAAGQSFVQTFTNDAYGNRTGGNNSHAAWSQSYHPAAGLPLTLVHGGVPVATSGAWSTGYDPLTWLPKAITYANGVSSSFEFGGDQERLGRIIHRGPGGTVQEDWSYGYDLVGNINKVFDNRAAGVFDFYGYDSLNRLVTAAIQSPTHGEQLQRFDYDTFGNRVQGTTERVIGWSGERGISNATVVPTTVSKVPNQTYNPLDPALLERNQLPATATNGAATGKVYDAQGNLLQVYEVPGDTINVLLMTYDALGRVKQVRHTGKGTREDYWYRADGLRTVVDFYQGDVYQTTRFQVYNDLRQLVAQYEKAGAGSLTWKKDIAYLGAREAGEIDASGVTVTQVDHLGSPRVMTRPGGQMIRQKFLPFGETLESGLPQTAKGFTGHEQTDVSGLIYMQARFYLPMYGRFASPDPKRDEHFEDTQGWNIYSYCGNNPVMRIDPDGMDWLDSALIGYYKFASNVPVVGSAMRLTAAVTNQTVSEGGVQTVGNGGARLSQAGNAAIGLLVDSATVASGGGMAGTLKNVAIDTAIGVGTDAAGSFIGGPHSETSGPVGDGLESHHTPARGTIGLPNSSGPAVQMEPSDHAMTASHARNGAAGAKWRSEAKAMVGNGQARNAMAREVKDVRRVANAAGNGRKYNKALQSMLKYAKKVIDLVK